MNRRASLQLFGATALSVPFLATSSARADGPSPGQRQNPSGKKTVLDQDGLVGGRTLEELHDRYAFDLFDDFLPFMEKHVIDHRHGGFMCSADREGNQVSTIKRGSHEGRGIWVYSHLYRTLAPEEKYLRAAEKSLDFLLPHEPPGDRLWPFVYSREGEAQGDPGDHGDRVYDEMYIVEGLAEYARATGNMEHWDHAKRILQKVVRLYDHPGHAPDLAAGNFPGGIDPIPGCRALGVSMLLIRVTSQMLEAREDPEMLALSNRAISEVFEAFYDPGFGLLTEFLNHDMSRPPSPVRDFVNTGHGITVLWMILYEAHRRRDKALFLQAAELLRRYLEVSWDRVYGGWFGVCQHVDDHQWALRKILWVQAEALVGLLFIMEHLGEEWAKDWFRKGYELALENFPLHPHGYALWDVFRDRKFTFVPEGNRVEHYHHPRHLMLNLQALKRIRDRNGAVSGDFA